jgi:Big-like domain-containing protein
MGIERSPRARLDVRSEVAMPGGELRYVIANEGGVPLLFGAGYGFEEDTTKGWQPLHVQQAFAAWGAQIAPGTSTGEMSARVPQDLSSGRYRLSTSLTVLQMNGAPVCGPSETNRITISCDFIVEESTGAST